MAALEDVQRLFLKQHLLELREVVRQARRLTVGHHGDAVGESLGYILRALSSLDAVRRELCELRVVNGMEAAMRNQEGLAVTCGIRKSADVGQKALGPGNVKLSVGQHEVGLSIHFPEDDVVSQSVALSQAGSLMELTLLPHTIQGHARICRRDFWDGPRELAWKSPAIGKFVY